MSVQLKWGESHPRTMLADLARHPSAGAALCGTQLAWREFYADVLRRSPDSAREYVKPDLARMEYDEPGSRIFIGFIRGQETDYSQFDVLSRS